MVSKALRKENPLILNADDAGIVARAKSYPGKICWFSLQQDNPLLQAQRLAGGTSFFLSGNNLICEYPDQRQLIANVKDIPITMAGAARHNISNCLAAAALAHSLDIEIDYTRIGLAAFSGDNQDNPGRGNYYHINGFSILLDFAHNAHGLSAIIDTVRRLPSRRRLIMFGHVGDRSDAEIRNLTRAACQLTPDQVIVTEVKQYLRGREPGDIPDIICAELRQAGRNLLR